MSNKIINTFNSGIFTPKMDTRMDTQKYSSGCRILENMIPLKYGCAERRPGTKYIATAKLNPSGIRVVSFIYNLDIAYDVEFGSEYARFFYGGELVDGADIETPYQVEDLPELQFFQINDVMWITHKNYAPRKLSRVSATSFQLSVIEFSGGPFLTRNDILNGDGIRLKCSVTAAGAAGSMTASSSLFDNKHTGALFSIVYPRDKVVDSLAAAGTSSGIDVKGTVTFTTHGTWTGTVKLQRKDGSSSYEDFRTYPGKDDRNVQFSYVEKEPNISYRIYADGVTGTFGAEIQVSDHTQTAIYRIDAVSSGTSAQVTVMQAAPTTNGLDTYSYRWSEGSWSMMRGYPGCVGSFGNRIIYASTVHEKSRYWLSAVNDYEKFEAGVSDSDSFSDTLMTTNDIVWISSLDGIVLGTTGGVWVVRSNKLESPVTPTNYSSKEYCTFGSAPIQAIKVDNVVLYADESRRKIREFTYGSSDSEYVSSDLTSFAEHITKNLIVAMAFQKNPDPILWVCLQDGGLLSMTYDREQNVVAWSTHPLGIDNNGSGISYPSLRDATVMSAPEAPNHITEIPLSAETDISTVDGLQAMSGSGHYKLTADIDLTGVNWVPVSGFSGVFDGQNHRILGLNIYHTGTAASKGLFETLASNAQVRNVIFDNCSVSSKIGSAEKGQAILAGYMNLATNVLIKNVSVTNSKIGPLLETGLSDDLYNAGFLVGKIQDSSLDIFDCNVINCTIDGKNRDLPGDTDGGWEYGGLIGVIELEEVSDYKINIASCNCSNLKIYCSGDTGGLIGKLNIYQGTSSKKANNNTVAIYDCDVSVSIESDGGLNIGGFVGNAIIGHTYARNNFFIMSGCSSTGDISSLGQDFEFIGGAFGSITTKNYGSAIVVDCHSTISISTIVRDLGYSGSNTLEFIGGFSGKLYGNAQSAIRMYDCTCSGNISLRLDVLGTIEFIGGFSGGIEGDSSYYWEYTGNEIWSEYLFNEWDEWNVGYERIKETTMASISRPSSSVVIRNCHCTGTIQCDTTTSDEIQYVGGFAGLIKNSSVIYSSSTGSVNCIVIGSQAYAGNIFIIGGFAGGIEARSKSSGTIDMTCSIFSCSAIGNVVCRIQGFSTELGYIFNVGGFSGYITSFSWVAGDVSASVNDCYARGNVECFITMPQELIPSAYNNGEIHEIGGFSGSISNSGFQVGSNTEIANIYSVGKISVSNPTREPPSSSNGYIQNIGAITGTTSNSTATRIERSYFDYESSETSVSVGGTPLSTELAKTKESYVLWDFDYVWKMMEWGVGSISVTPSTGEDTVTISVARIINGTEVRYIEQMSVRAFGKQEDAFFVDCGKVFTGSMSSSFATLEYLEGETVKVYGDGSYVGEFVVTQGTVNLPDSYFKVHIGLPFQYRLQPMRFDLDTYGNSAYGSNRKISDLTISFLETLNAKYGSSMDNLFDILWRTTEPYTTPPKLFTGDKRVVMDGGFSTEDPILIVGDDPFPCTVRAIFARIDITDL